MRIINLEKVLLAILLVLSLQHEAESSELKFQFVNPSFSGNGTSAHWLTIENQEHSRKQAIQDKIEAELKARATEEQNSILNRFMYNLQSRLYSQLASQLTQNLFSSDSNTGSFSLDGNTIDYVKTDNTITLTITDQNNSTTVITIPTAGFGF